MERNVGREESEGTVDQFRRKGNMKFQRGGDVAALRGSTARNSPIATENHGKLVNRKSHQTTVKDEKELRFNPRYNDNVQNGTEEEAEAKVVSFTRYRNSKDEKRRVVLRGNDRTQSSNGQEPSKEETERQFNTMNKDNEQTDTEEDAEAKVVSFTRYRHSKDEKRRVVLRGNDRTQSSNGQEISKEETERQFNTTNKDNEQNGTEEESETKVVSFMEAMEAMDSLDRTLQAMERAIQELHQSQVEQEQRGLRMEQMCLRLITQLNELEGNIQKKEENIEKSEEDEQSRQLYSIATKSAASAATKNSAPAREEADQQKTPDPVTMNEEDETRSRTKQNRTATDGFYRNQRTEALTSRNCTLDMQSKQTPIQTADIRALLLHIEELQRQVSVCGSKSEWRRRRAYLCRLFLLW